MADDQKVEVRLVDLGVAVAKIRKDRSCIHFDGTPNPYTKLTLVMPASMGDSGYEPATSFVLDMDEQQLKSLIEGLS